LLSLQDGHSLISGSADRKIILWDIFKVLRIIIILGKANQYTTLQWIDLSASLDERAK
jgi:hypothetical protein